MSSSGSVVLTWFHLDDQAMHHRTVGESYAACGVTKVLSRRLNCWSAAELCKIWTELFQRAEAFKHNYIKRVFELMWAVRTFGSKLPAELLRFRLPAPTGSNSAIIITSCICSGM